MFVEPNAMLIRSIKRKTPEINQKNFSSVNLHILFHCENINFISITKMETTFKKKYHPKQFSNHNSLARCRMVNRTTKYSVPQTSKASNGALYRFFFLHFFFCFRKETRGHFKFRSLLPTPFLLLFINISRGCLQRLPPRRHSNYGY